MYASRVSVVALCLLGGALAAQYGEEASMLQLSAQKSPPDADPTSPTAVSLAESECDKDIRDCIAFGDPHFITFDGGVFKFHGRKDFYLVKSERIIVQGRSMGFGGNLAGLAVTGDFINNRKLTITKTGTNEQGSIVEVKLDGKTMFETSSSFAFPELEGRHDIATKLSDNEKMRLKTQKQTLDTARFKKAFHHSGKAWLFRFGQGAEQLTLLVSAYDQLTALLTMRGVFGQDGYCGNFNRIAADDGMDDLIQRGKVEDPVPREANLFKSGLEDTTYDNCRYQVPTAKAAAQYMIGSKDDIKRANKEECAKFCMGFATAAHFDLALTTEKGSKYSFANCRCFPAIYGATKKNPKQSRMMCDLTRENEHTCTTEKEVANAKKVCSLLDNVEKKGCLDDEDIQRFKTDCVEDFCETGDHLVSVNAAAAEKAIEKACSSTTYGKNWGHLNKILKKMDEDEKNQ